MASSSSSTPLAPLAHDKIDPPFAPASKDSGKKKRMNRAAKLKQSKLDVRREQWLAQVSGKLSKSESCPTSMDDRGEGSRSAACNIEAGIEDSDLSLDGSRGSIEEYRSKISRPNIDVLNGDLKVDKAEHEKGVQGTPIPELEAQQPSILEGRKQDSPGSHFQNSETSDMKYLKGRDNPNEAEGKSSEDSSLARIHMHGFSTWSSSDASTSRSNSSRASSSCAGSGSDDDEANEVDDWEAAADALHVQASLQEAMLSKSSNQLSGREPIGKKALAISRVDPETCALKPEIKYRGGAFGARMRTDAGRAWRPDDVSRPPTLPRLSKQHSFPLQSGTSVWGALHGSIWGLPPAPSHCPICTEELDTTDSSFVPCLCGFRLCLFCHHKIVLGDGRCPGCRKSYNSEVAIKLSRTSSVRPRV